MVVGTGGGACAAMLARPVVVASALALNPLLAVVGAAAVAMVLALDATKVGT